MDLKGADRAVRQTGPSTLGEGIDVAAGRELYDAQCKRLLSERSVLAWILKGCLGEFGDMDPCDIAHGCIAGDPLVGKVPVTPGLTNAPRLHAGTSDSVPYEGAVEYDILLNAVVPGDEQEIDIVVNVETQLDYHPGYPLENRALFYCARMISAQYGEVFTQSHYERLRKVVSIWVCPRSPQKRRSSVDRGMFVMYDGVGSRSSGDEGSTIPRDCGLLEVVFVNLGSLLREEEGLAKSVDEGLTGDATTDMTRFLATLLTGSIGSAEKRRIIEDVYGIPMVPGLSEGVDYMVHVVDMIWAEAKEEGLAEGKMQGMAEGAMEATLSVVRNIMEKTGWDAERALDVAGVPVDEVPRYLELLNSKTAVR